MPDILTKDDIYINIEINRSNGVTHAGKKHTVIADSDFWFMLEGKNIEKDNEGNVSVELADKITIRYKDEKFTLQKPGKCV